MYKKLLILLALVLLVGCGSNESEGPEETKVNIDEEVYIEKAVEIIDTFIEKDYEKLDEFAGGDLVGFFLEEENQNNTNEIMENFGEFKEYKDNQVFEHEEGGMDLVIVQQKTEFEKKDLLFTVTFNEDMEMVGFFLK